MNSLSASPLEPKLVTSLKNIQQSDLDSAGGKGANLGALVRADFPVPKGFVITTAAYDRFVTYGGLQEILNFTQAEAISNGTGIRSAFESAPIPPEVEQEVLSAYEQLGRGPVAVRSSATSEDLPEAAFAGQQDTYLNIVGLQALLDAVRRCWASLWTDRAIAYRERQGIDQGTVKLAVVVQVMVAAEAAGVMFTANPVSGARDEVVIDASPGLGEAVVSGLVTPDHFVLKKQRLGWSITERRTGLREVIIQARSDGGTEHIEGRPGERSGSLSDQALYQLASLGTAIEHHFGSPQDIEWASANDKMYILQSRHMTALPEPLPVVNRLQRMLASNFAEMLPVRPYPIDLDTWMPALGSAVEPIFEILGLKWYFSHMFEEEDGIVFRYTPKLPHPTWRVLLAPLKLLRTYLRYNPFYWQSDPLLVDSLKSARDLGSRKLGALTWEQLLEVVHAAKKIPYLVAGEIRRRYFPRAAFAAIRMRLFLGLMGHNEKFGTLLAGVENKTTEMNRALEELAAKVRADPELANIFAEHTTEKLLPALDEMPSGQLFLLELRAYLDQYGHRESMISTVLQPTWKDSPEIVLGIIKSFAARPNQTQSRKPDWEAARDEVLRHPLLKVSPLRIAFLGILSEARTVLQLREDTHFYATLPLPIFRRTFFEMGNRLVSAGVTGTAEDVFHLKLSQLEQLSGRFPPPEELAAEIQASVIRRKKARARLDNKPLVDPRLFPDIEIASDALLSGMPGSPGVAEGPACIIQDASQFDKLSTGDVLVAPYTNPSWTPLFQRAAAVVVDSGSVASHAAIVAREYGIPAVMATQTGTRILHDGEKVRVDGSRGTVMRVTPVTTEGEEQDKNLVHRDSDS